MIGGNKMTLSHLTLSSFLDSYSPIVIHITKTFWRNWIIHKTQLWQTRRSIREGSGEESGVSNPAIFLVSVTASLHWQPGRDDMASPSVSGGGVMYHSFALNETRANEGMEMRKRKMKGLWFRHQKNRPLLKPSKLVWGWEIDGVRDWGKG